MLSAGKAHHCCLYSADGCQTINAAAARRHPRRAIDPRTPLGGAVRFNSSAVAQVLGPPSGVAVASSTVGTRRNQLQAGNGNTCVSLPEFAGRVKNTPALRSL